MLNIPTINMIATGQNIVMLRQQRNLTVKDLQDFFGFANPQTIYKWQHGQAMPTIDNLIVLATIFNVSIEDILVLNHQIVQITA